MAYSPHAGDLELRPLPAVLLDLHDVRATGRFLVRRERVVKTLDLIDGDLVAAPTHDETLGHFLVAAGVINPAQHRDAVNTATSRRIPVGVALIELGLLTPDRLAEQLSAQTRYRLLSPLRWNDGAWRFETREVHMDGVRLPTPETVLGGLRDTSSEGPSASQMLIDVFLELTGRGEQLLPLFRSVFGARLPQRLPEGITARGLIEQGLTTALLDAMILTDAVVPALPKVGPALALKTNADTGERSPLYAELFGGHSTMAPLPVPSGSDPLDLEHPDEFDVDELLDDDSTRQARAALIAESYRVRDLDHYSVLMVERDAGDLDIAAALSERQSQFSRDYYARFQLGRDVQLIEEIHGAYEAARDVLLDDDRRRAYDRELAGGDLTGKDAEADRLLQTGLDLLQKGDAETAAEKLEAALALRPEDPEGLAALGWAVWHREEKTAEAADLARTYLGRALRKKPQLATANEYLGLIELALGADEHAALDHLERAARGAPGHAVVLDAVASLHLRHGRYRALERFYRRLLRGGAGSPHDQAALWQRLAVVLSDHLDDPAAARQAFHQAARLGGTPRTQRRIPTPRPTQETDAEFVALSIRVAAGEDGPGEREQYEELRPRALPRARTTMSRELWNLLRHPDDQADVGALAELVAPAVHALHPVTLADLAVDAGARVADAELPPAFGRLRAYTAELLGLVPAPVYAQPDFGADVHVGAGHELVLLAGDEALTAPDRPELGFRLARATSYLWPGRAVGASRPARVMRALFLALFKETVGDPGASGDAEITGDLGVEDPARAALASLDRATRDQARALAQRLLARSQDHNLSRWALALGRTADRFGLLVCGDVPVAVRLAVSPTADGDLLDFARSEAFLRLRAALGLTVSAPPPPGLSIAR